MFPEAFSEDKRVRNKYLILKTIGVYPLNYLANDIFNWCQKGSEVKVPSEDEIRKYLELLKDFDWGRNTSPLAGLGGMKGIKIAHAKLLKHLANQGCIEAQRAIESYNYAPLLSA
ncbi:MAG: hypothetical protein QXH24_07465 [Candidatus Bathyarchaeia archaeon]